MTALQPYPAYKDSGVEWLGEVPEHWAVRRASNRLRVTEPANTRPLVTITGSLRDPPIGLTLAGASGFLLVSGVHLNPDSGHPESNTHRADTEKPGEWTKSPTDPRS